MFERFTDRARRCVAAAQEEARGFKHNFIGTEHLLLGLFAEPDGVAARALAELGVSRDWVREEVLTVVGPGETAPRKRHISFTPRAKRTLETSLREALKLGHNYIGTEHVLLALAGGDGVGAQILSVAGVTKEQTVQVVVSLLSGMGKAVGAEGTATRYEALKLEDAVRRLRATAPGPRCPGCGAGLAETAAHRTMEVPGDQEAPPATVLFLYCRGCGHVLDDVILPGE